MKIIFLTHSSDQGHRFRVEQYFPYLIAHQVEPKWEPLSGSGKERLILYRQLPFFDVVCIQRRLLSPFEFYKKYLLNTAQLCWADENRFAKR
jgi:hypothetical protein